MVPNGNDEKLDGNDEFQKMAACNLKKKKKEYFRTFEKR